MKSVCVLHVLTVDAYKKIAEIVDPQANVQIVVGNSVAAGIKLINQQQLIFPASRIVFFISVSYSRKYSLICLMLNSPSIVFFP
jgi:hypothetical protein